MLKIYFKQFLIAMVALLCSTTVGAQTHVNIDGIYYSLYENVASVVRPEAPIETIYVGDIVIPKVVAYNGVGYRVTSIGPYAFGYCSGITSITIPESVTSIGDHAFVACSGITSITIPESVTSIYDGTFYGCSGLTSITIPESVTSIYDMTFYGCSGLTSITIPKNVTYIGQRTFYGCSGLISIFVEEGNPKYDSRKNCNAIIASATNTLIQGCKTTVIPNTVKCIGRDAFQGFSITSITIPGSVTSIEYGAFPQSLGKLVCEAQTPPSVEANYSLGNIVIVYVPKGCKDAYRAVNPWSDKILIDGSEETVAVETTPGMLGEDILKSPKVKMLKDIYYLVVSGSVDNSDFELIKDLMPNLVTIDMAELEIESIPWGVFSGKKNFMGIVLPKSLKSIDGYAFQGCINLELKSLPEGLERIGNYAFAGCKFNTLSFPTTLKSIGDGAFKECYNLKDIVFNDGLQSIGKSAFKNCGDLTNIIIPDGITSISDSTFAGCSRVKEIKFGINLKTIHRAAFSGCRFISKLLFPKNLHSIAESAFYGCSALEHIDFEGELKYIGSEYETDDEYYYGNYPYGAFEGCTLLKTVELPKGLKNIYQRTFANCYSLTQVNIPEGVEFIGKKAFEGCSNLREVTLPSSLMQISSNPFAGCNKLSKVSCLALFPPQLKDGVLPEIETSFERILYAPGLTYSKYKLSNGWGLFDDVLPLDGVYPDQINIVQDNTILNLPDTLPEDYKPDLNILAYYFRNNSAYGYIYGPSSLDLRGNDTLCLNNFNIEIKNQPEYYVNTVHQLLNRAEVVAENVNVKMSLGQYGYNEYGYDYRTTWHFLSFPFDVKISDVTTKCDWIVRRYDGAARAECDYNNTWVTVPQDGMLSAGEGYIWACNGGDFDLSAIDNENKNLIFSKDTCFTVLKEYISEADIMSDNSWNLIGNPYPCYYDTREMIYTAPITVWDSNNGTYSAYSPVDDSYILQPFEAFFVQKPEGVDTIKFAPEGRQLSAVASEKEKVRALPRVYSTANKRDVVNLLLSNDRYTDRTRFVINENARIDYEMNCDAAKFMSTDAIVPQLFTINGDEKYAINERPMGDAIVRLGTHFGEAGSYTISLEGSSNLSVMLVDLENNTETDLCKDSYTFDAETSDCSRFIVRLCYGGTTGITQPATQTEVYTINGAIVVTASNDMSIEVYNAQGIRIATACGSNEVFNVAQGTYIVKVNGNSHKVTVVK